VEKRAGAASETVSLATNSCPGNPQSLFPQSVSAGGSAEIVLFFYLWVKDFYSRAIIDYGPSVQSTARQYCSSGKILLKEPHSLVGVGPLPFCEKN
jgi:hypothetical protein